MPASRFSLQHPAWTPRAARLAHGAQRRRAAHGAARACTREPGPCGLEILARRFRRLEGRDWGPDRRTLYEFTTLCFVFLGADEVGWVFFVVVVAGPDRPVPEKLEPHVAQGGFSEWKAGSSKAGDTATSTAQTKSALYERLHAAVSERGWACFLIILLEMLDLTIIQGNA